MMGIMGRAITVLFVVVLLLGFAVSMDWIPRSLFDSLPRWSIITLLSCWLLFCLAMWIGDITDSGILKRFFRKKD